ncbi:hypothetical protein V8E55_011736 [Tylopilus felleus]
MHSAIIYMAWSADTARKCLFIGCLDGGLTVIEHLNAEEPTNSPVMSGTKAPIFAITTHQGTGHIAFAIGSEIHLAKEVTKDKYVTFNILPAPEVLPNTSDQEDQRIHGWDIAFKEHGKQSWHTLITDLRSIVLDSFTSVRLMASKILYITLGWACNHFRSAELYFRNKALALVGYLYEQLRGGIDSEVPSPFLDKTNFHAADGIVTDLVAIDNIIYL